MNKEQQLLEVLKYFSKSLNLLIPEKEFAGVSFADFSKKFHIFLVKFLQKQTRGTAEYENGIKLWKIFTRFLNSVENNDPPSAAVQKEWEDMLSKKSLSRSSRTKVL